jgi:hypothetical protein
VSKIWKKYREIFEDFRKRHLLIRMSR